ncbi:hypothetical protein [Bradyrhizobium sp. NP1]|uniref:hypothetical protein n=1 Tax=Bradyrhizobium sp. NP1 TaxID=3049772 RepID=UPI0025A60506|nr:hypothetical protein [Bradyrhizobium sp. NP1]WJR78490.1 hypothetical protein QOU61_01355 [Bradyrhizobium sp. NP1]
MKVALLSMTLLGAPLTPVSDRLPEVNVDALCKGRSAQDRLMQLPEAQPVPDCVRDEKDARQRLDAVWGSTSPAIRTRCQSEARALGTKGYLDLLTCIQMAEDIPPLTPATERKSRNRK